MSEEKKPSSATPVSVHAAVVSLVENAKAHSKFLAEQQTYNMELGAFIHVATAMIEALFPNDPAERKRVEERFLIACDRIRPDELGPKPNPKRVAAHDRLQLAWQKKLRAKP